MTDIEKCCVLLFNEMTIKKGLEYNHLLGILEGYEDMGNIGRTLKPATQALVFMEKVFYFLHRNYRYVITYQRTQLRR